MFNRLFENYFAISKVRGASEAIRKCFEFMLQILLKISRRLVFRCVRSFCYGSLIVCEWFFIFEHFLHAMHEFVVSVGQGVGFCYFVLAMLGCMVVTYICCVAPHRESEKRQM